MISASILGGLAAAWWLNKQAAANERSAAGNVSLMENLTASWLNDLNTRGARYKHDLLAAEDRHGIPRYLLARLAWQESRYREDVVTGKVASSAGALGIMQIVPRWHPSMSRADCLNPPKAIEYAADYLAALKRQFGTWELALKAYNWGPGNVSAWLRGEKREPAETATYSKQILADYRSTTGRSIA